MPSVRDSINDTTRIRITACYGLACISFLSLLLTTFGCNPEEQPYENSEIRTVVDSRQIAAQGKLMPAGGIISLSATPGDQIESILVKSGQQVSQGDVLIVMRSNQIRQIELQAAQTRLAEAKVQFKSKQTEVRLALEAANLKLEQSKLAKLQAEQQLKIAESGNQTIKTLQSQIDRLRELRAKPQLQNVIGQSEIDVKEIELRKAEQIYESSILTGKQAIDSANLAVRMAEQNRVAAEESLQLIDQSSSIESLEKQIELLEVQLELTRVIAPSNATVLAVMASVGETAGPTPVIDVADLSSMICVAEVHEADVARLSIGDRAVLSSAALPSVLNGTVIQVDPLVGSPQMRLPNPMARSDFRAVPVRIKIDESQQAIAARLVQLQVDVTITPTGNASAEVKPAS